MPRSFFSSIIGLLVSLALLVIGLFAYEVVGRPMLPHAASAEILINQGDTITALSKRLEHQGWIRSATCFRIAFLLQYSDKSLKSGNYEVFPQDTAWSLIDRIARGEVLQEAFTIIEGQTWEQVWQKLSQDDRLLHSSKEEIATTFLAIGIYPDAKGLEGVFLPITYHFAQGVNDVQVLMHAFTELKLCLEKAWQERSPDCMLKTPYEGLIVASLIEREAKLSEEFFTVSGVIQNRLKKGMPLQIDAAVLYGKPGQQTPLTRKALNKITPYNTYKKRGLPPTRIAMPSRDAIVAALHPEQTKALYYVVNQQGGHYFSHTYAAHLRAVRKLKKEKK